MTHRTWNGELSQCQCRRLLCNHRQSMKWQFSRRFPQHPSCLCRASFATINMFFSLTFLSRSLQTCLCAHYNILCSIWINCLPYIYKIKIQNNSRSRNKTGYIPEVVSRTLARVNIGFWSRSENFSRCLQEKIVN